MCTKRNILQLNRFFFRLQLLIYYFYKYYCTHSNDSCWKLFYVIDVILSYLEYTLVFIKLSRFIQNDYLNFVAI